MELQFFCVSVFSGFLEMCIYDKKKIITLASSAFTYIRIKEVNAVQALAPMNAALDAAE